MKDDQKNSSPTVRKFLVGGTTTVGREKSLRGDEMATIIHTPAHGLRDRCPIVLALHLHGTHIESGFLAKTTWIGRHADF